jgi:acyl-coenzyme A thioesterase PaaI-like protein
MATAAAAAEHAAGRTLGETLVSRYVTAALRVDYLRPTPLGQELVLRGRVTEKSDKKAVVAVTVSAGWTITVRAEVVAVRMPESMAGNQATDD